MSSRRLAIVVLAIVGLILAVLFEINRNRAATGIQEPQSVHENRPPSESRSSSIEPRHPEEPGTSRKEILAEEHFWNRYYELVSDTSYRRQIRDPQEAQLARTIEQGLPLPFTQVCEDLARAGVVPPPETDAMLEIEMYAIGTATRLLESQARSLTGMDWNNRGGTFATFLEREAGLAAFLAPEVLGTLLHGADIREEIRHSDRLRAELTQIRTDACIEYGLAWTELDYFRHCAFQASLESGVKLPTSAERDLLLAGEHQEMAAALSRLEGVHKRYLSNLSAALSQHFSR